MATDDKRRASLSAYQKRVLREYERILEITGLNPTRALDLAEENPKHLAPVLKTMTDQAVRSDVIYEYTMIDMELDSLIFHHFFGYGKSLRAARRTKRYKTLFLILQNMYILQKLSIVRSFKNMPSAIASKIGAINDIRNVLAHTFFVSDLKKSKRTYKGHNIFTPKGLEVFHRDVKEVRYFFMPWLKTIMEDEN